MQNRPFRVQNVIVSKSLSMGILFCRCFPLWLRTNGRISVAGRPKVSLQPKGAVCVLDAKSNPCRTTFWKIATSGAMAKSQGWKRPKDAECLKAPFTGKLDGFGKMTLIVSNKVYFLGKSIFLPLGKKIVAVKPRWIIKFSFAPRPLKVQFLGNGWSNGNISPS